MKKSLLSLLAAMVISAGSAMALDLQKAPFEAGKTMQKAPAKAVTENGYELDFCGDISTWYYFSQTDLLDYMCYIYIDPELATSLAGNELTEVTFSFASTKNNAKRTGSIFVYEDLDAEPVVSTEVQVVNSYATSATYNQTAAFTTPYVIKENTGFYYGLKITKCRVSNLMGTDYPVGVTEQPAGAYAGMVKITNNSTGAVLGTYDVGAELGKSLYLKAKTVGEKKGPADAFSVINAALGGSFTLPTLANLDQASAFVQISNIGSTDGQTIDYSVAVNDGEATNMTADIDLPSGVLNWIELPLPTLPTGNNTITLTINKINSKEIGVYAQLPYLGAEGEGYPRKFVVEEGTGTWCGWCPRGIVGFEYMETNYPDSFIGIAVHSGDNMSTTTYNALLNKFDGFPSCVINRDFIYYTDPSAGVLQECYDIWETQPGVAQVSLEVATPAANKAEVTATTEFGFTDTKAKYALAFVVLENGIIDQQSNYYAGGGNGKMGGWENYSNPQAWVYKHVARDIFSCNGLSNSVPTSVEAGTPYEFTYNVSLSKVTDVSKSAIVALLLDKNTGVILNAAKVEAADYGMSAIGEIASEENAPVEYYNIQGVRMPSTNLPAGVYITRQGNKVNKVIVK